MIVTKVSVTQRVLGNLETSWLGTDYFVSLPQTFYAYGSISISELLGQGQGVPVTFHA